MDYTTIISFIPKLAAAILLILGILIILEIRSMIVKGKKQEKKPQEKETIAVVQFPKAAVNHLPGEGKKPISLKSLLPLISIPILVVLLYFVFTKVSNIQIANPLNIAETSPQKDNKTPAVVMIYEISESNQWQALSYDQLESLPVGKTVKIAVSSSRMITSAEFSINDETLTSGSNRTPYNEPYVDYVIQPGIIDYHIAVSVRYE